MTFDPTYLQQAIDRAAAMIKQAVPNSQVVTYIDPNLTTPFWWVYLDRLQPDEQAYGLTGEIWPVNMRYVVGYVTEGFDGVKQRSVYTALPTVKNYFDTHKRLIYADGQASIPYLNPAKLRIDVASNFGLFSADKHIGIELRLLLPFKIEIEQEY